MVDDKSRGLAEPPSVPSLHTVAGDAASDSTVLSQPVVAKPVQRLGRYALLERLGVGGMAEVYLAEQAGAAGFHKKVVVKRILPHLAADRQFVDMFAREAKVAARVSHPNVVQIFELAEQEGEFFIAMEHIDGLTLHRLAASSWEQGWALPVDVVCRTLADAATGLHAAHLLVDENGQSVHLVHRDVSPDNLMVSKDGVTKVLDFGIAKGDVGGPKTKTGNLRGKIPFMPPEQITGELLDGRADLYALGVSAYWMLTGERPFDRQSDWHTMHAILNDVPKAPSTINPGVPAALDQLVLQLLEKKRESRPITGREVADRLEDIASAGSMGGKKTTVAFLAHLLPAASSRGNPVSEVQPKPDPRPPPGHTAPAFASVPPSSSVPPLPPVSTGTSAVDSSGESTPVVPGAAGASAAPVVGPVEPVVPLVPLVPLAPLVPVTGVDVTVPATAMAQHGSEAPELTVVGHARTPLDPNALIAPVTTPAGANAFGNVLAPANEGSGISVPVVLLGLLVVAGIVGGGAYAIYRFAGSPGTSTADAGMPVVADAGPPAVVPPPPPPPPVAPRPISVKTPNAPSRVRWFAGDVVVGIGAGSVFAPAGTKNLIAEDMRWKVRSTVPVNAGVADYGALPTGQVQLVRTSDRIKVTLGDDDVSRQRKLKLVAGHYVFKVDKAGSKKDIPVEIKGGENLSLDVAR